GSATAAASVQLLSGVATTSGFRIQRPRSTGEACPSIIQTSPDTENGGTPPMSTTSEWLVLRFSPRSHSQFALRNGDPSRLSSSPSLVNLPTFCRREPRKPLDGTWFTLKSAS